MFICLVLICASLELLGQTCADKISQAEEDYRNGRYDEMKSQICSCFGIYRDEDGKIRPRKFASLIAELQQVDSIYAPQLGTFKEYWEHFIGTGQTEDVFSYEERYRAYILLGKVYNDLNVMPLAEFFSRKALSLDPGRALEEEESGFKRIYDSQIGTVKEITFGVFWGWIYSIPIEVTNNRRRPYDFQTQTNGKVMLGLQYNYFVKPYLVLSANFWWHSTNVVYIQPTSAGGMTVDFFSQEKQDWLKFPVMIKWSSREHLNIFKKSETLRGKIFFGAGIVVDYLNNSNIILADRASNTTLFEFNTAADRNRFNYEVLLQGIARFKLGRNYLTFGFTGLYTLKDILKDGQGSLYDEFEIVENNYKLLSGFYTLTYEFRFSTTKGKLTH